MRCCKALLEKLKKKRLEKTNWAKVLHVEGEARMTRMTECFLD